MSNVPRLGDDLLFGIPRIAEELGLKRRQVDYLVQQNKIPVIRLTEQIIVASRRKLRAVMTGETSEDR